ncbi:MAG: tetratricopeptide repeat protein [Treponemataceae bacterium]|nr:tetratricopeptide repeat protein [Treponemataceae bacterium]
MTLRKKMTIFAICAFFLACKSLFAGNYDKGLSLFCENKPAEAIIYLQQAILENGVNPDVYNYLGLAYYQTGQFQKSLEVFQLGTGVSGTDRRRLYYNAGNSAFSLGYYDRAVEMYSYALAANPTFSSALLNRANARMKEQSYEDAITDYTQYIELEPDSSQAESIKRLIELLSSEIVSKKEEEERLAAENERIRLEQERVAEERRKIAEERLAQEQEAARKEAEKQAAEAERRRKLLQQVADTLKTGDAETVSVNTQSLILYEEEAELD